MKAAIKRQSRQIAAYLLIVITFAYAMHGLDVETARISRLTASLCDSAISRARVETRLNLGLVVAEERHRRAIRASEPNSREKIASSTDRIKLYQEGAVDSKLLARPFRQYCK